MVFRDGVAVARRPNFNLLLVDTFFGKALLGRESPDFLLLLSWRDGRVAEGTGLLNRRMGIFLYRGFESLSLRFL